MKLKLAIALLCFFVSSVTAQNSILPNFIANINHPKIGLVLSGGGAKGLAHIGVLKVLEQYGIRPDYITGTSMGAIVGGLYSLGYSAKDIEQFVHEADWNALLSDKITWKEIDIFHKDEYPGYPVKLLFERGEKPSLPSGMIEGQQIHALLSKLSWASIKYQSFDDLPIPFRCVATDIMTGQPMVFKGGSLADAMRTSMSIPTVFSPVIVDSLLLADGGMVRNYPVQECLGMGADIIIGSYTGFDEKAKPEDMRSLINILTRSSVFQGINDAKVQIPKTDVLIVPDLTGFGAESFSKTKQIMEKGEEAANDSVIIKKLKEIALVYKFWPKDITKDSLGNIKVDQLIISGPPTADIKLIEEMCNIYPGKEVNQETLAKAVDKLYSTGDYKKVSYQIINHENKNILVFKCAESEAGKIELGLHYDNTYGPAILAKYTMRDFLIPSGLLKAKIALSENSKLQINYDYFLTKRKNSSVFFESYLQTSKMPNVLRNSDTLMTLGHYRFNNFSYSAGFKFRLWKNGMITTSIGQNYNALKLKEGMQYLFEMERLNYMHNFVQAEFKINNLDDPFFPTKGIFIKLAYKSIFNAQMSNAIDVLYTEGLSSRNEIIGFNYQQYIRIKKRFTIIPQISIGLMQNKSFLAEEFFIGGNNYQLQQNSVNMSGIKANNIIADNYIKLGISAQLQVFDRWFLQYGQETLGFIDYQQVYSEAEIVEGQSVTGWYCGLGVSSRIGPLRLICSGSYEYEGLSWSLNLGIPF